MKNSWNRLVYRLWAPVYDAALGRVFEPGRKRAMALAALRAGERVCLIGVGTGNDLPLLAAGTSAIGIDLSTAMLARAQKKLPIEGCEVELRVGDAQELPVDTASVDVVILNLILSVVPDPQRCMSEALRVLRAEGRIVVFDKFLPDHGEPPMTRKMANVVSKLFGTDINRRLADMISALSCQITQDEPSIMGGMYRVVQLRPAPRHGADSRS